MSASQFTPGPWALTSMGGQTLVHVGEDRIGRVFTRNGHANAHLIAAAPELYEAVDAAREYIAAVEGEGLFVAKRNALADLDALLAKARGEQ